MQRDPRGWLRRELGTTPAAEPAAEPAPPAEPTATFIQEGCQLEGRLAVRSSIRITGEFRGTIASDETVTIDADAAVEADVRARMVIVHGALVGCVDASREVVLHAGARLHGDVRSPSIVIERGAFFIGRTEMYRPEIEARRQTPAPEPAPPRSGE